MGDEEKKTSPLTMGDIRKFVTDTVGELVKSGKEVDPAKDKDTEDRTPRGGDIKSEVERELAKIKSREERNKRDTELDTKIKELTEKTAEKPPVERSKVHRFMGWGD
jgi:hypothetical protein